MIYFITTIFIITRHDIIMINNDKRIVVRKSLLQNIQNRCYNKIITSDDHIITSDDRIITNNEKIIDVNNRYQSFLNLSDRYFFDFLTVMFLNSNFKFQRLKIFSKNFPINFSQDMIVIMWNVMIDHTCMFI